MEFILNNWYVILIVLLIIAFSILIIASYLSLPKAQRHKKVKEWLLYAVTEAEKALGGGTGQIKLRYVYDMFLTKFSFISKIISFDTFSRWVDDALENMRNLLKNNKDINNYVNGDEKNDS